MKKLFSNLLILLLVASPAYGQTALELEHKETVYFGVHGGHNNNLSWPVKADLGANVVVDGALSLERKWNAGAQLGWERDHARIELEYQRGEFGIERYRLGIKEDRLRGTLRYDTVMLNAHRAFDLSDWAALNLGGGAGWGRTRFPKVPVSPSCDCLPGASKGGFAYQGRVGLEFRLDRRTSLLGNYSRLFLPKSTAGVTGSTVYDQRNFGLLSGGLLVRFGRDLNSHQHREREGPASAQ